jgi:hypothetical protein
MRISNLAAVLALTAATSVLAQNAPPPAAAGGAKLDQSPLFNAVDTNKDGKVTAAEWAAAGLPDMIYGMIDSKQSNAAVLADFDAAPPPDGADANQDGKFTLDEIKLAVAGLGGGGPPGGGGAPPAGAPPAGAPPAK